ncbi:hypothetical protein KBK19_16090 [Microvirga sp. STR05]|uniref:Tetratricopeptide repeat protein n=1 Tax=Hymenobacter duratus TaxID=2771356 RepID=A0ABR8JP42_9BACT|nr:hypothetical protein [Hymenobacter duratus]MBD2716564.1 hypothetical protein [Hymenobacter duratus]MBR7951479.1 hypothetical protein [Microvirga sp. STR05]
MTRASLLHILDHVSRISEAEVRELEQLATTFPYCQTAHVLLAKAAHDRGSMLASQRLRRAATYATDRQLLRQLLEQPAQEPAALLADAADSTRPATLPAGTATTFLQTLGTEDVQALEVSEAEPTYLSVPEDTGEEPVAANTTSAELVPSSAEEEGSTSEELAVNILAADNLEDAAVETPLAAEATESATATTIEVTTAPATDPVVAPAASAETAAHSEAGVEVADDEPVDTTDDSSVFEQPISLDANQPAPAEAAVVEQPAPALLPETDELLPAVAPPIRPPVEAGISRFEFGLGGSATPPVSALYQLPGADEEEEEPLPVSRETVPLFRSDAELAYALLGGGSRLGYALQMQDGELTSALPADEFFAPDALLHAHGVAHRPKAEPGPSPFDLINRFLKNQPRLKSPAVRLSLAEEQTDLSVRSTSVVPQLASESLAKIMVKQGKIDKAIEIYERLMVRQPEKSAYFTDQIQQLQTPE